MLSSIQRTLLQSSVIVLRYVELPLIYPCQRFLRTPRGSRKPSPDPAFSREGSSEDVINLFDNSVPSFKDIWQDEEREVTKTTSGSSKVSVSSSFPPAESRSTDKKVESADLLMDRINRCKFVDEVLKLVERHDTIMNVNHLLRVVEILCQNIKASPPMEKERQNLLNDHRISILFTRLIRSHRYMSPGQTLDVLKLCSFLKVASNARIVQVYLTLVRDIINDMNLNDLMYASFLISNFPDNRLAEALLIAIPIAFELHATKEMDPKNLKQLIQMLKFCARFRVNMTISTNLKTAIWHRLKRDAESRASLSLDEAADLFVRLDKIGRPFWELNNILFETMDRKKNEAMQTYRAQKLLSSLRYMRAKHPGEFEPNHVIFSIEERLLKRLPDDLPEDWQNLDDDRLGSSHSFSSTDKGD